MEAQQQIGRKFHQKHSFSCNLVHTKTDSNYELEDSGMADDGSDSGSLMDQITQVKSPSILPPEPL